MNTTMILEKININARSVLIGRMSERTTGNGGVDIDSIRIDNQHFRKKIFSRWLLTMSNRLIDAHIHLDMYKPAERSLILNDMKESGVDALITVSNHLASAQKNMQLARHDSRVKLSIGFHPEQPLPSDEDLADLLTLIDHHQHEIVAIGEIGLPYYLRREGKVASRGAYMDVLDAFIQKAVELDKPIALHAIYDDAPMACDL